MFTFQYCSVCQWWVAAKISAACSVCFCYLKTSDLFQVYLAYLATLLNFDWLQFFTPRKIHFNWLRSIVMRCPRAIFPLMRPNNFPLMREIRMYNTYHLYDSSCKKQTKCILTRLIYHQFICLLPPSGVTVAFRHDGVVVVASACPLHKCNVSI